MRLENTKVAPLLKTAENGQSITVENTEARYIHDVLVNSLCLKALNVDDYNVHILEEVLNKDFSPVENHTFIGFYKSKKKFETYYDYFHNTKHNFFICIERNLSVDYDKEEFQEGKFKISVVYYDKTSEDYSQKIVEYLNNSCIIEKNTSNKIFLVLQTQKGAKFQPYKIKSKDVSIEEHYNDDFKPVHQHIVNSLKNDNKGIVMLHGLPGTAKTEYIKYLTTQVVDKNFVFVPVGMITHLSSPDFISTLVDNKGSILVLEDCENYIQERDTAGQNNVVSTILNIADGVLSDILGIQFICTFNADMTKIDKALLREGRLIAEYYFDKLSLEKTKNLYKDAKEPMTIAQLMNVNKKHFKETKQHKKIGFAIREL